MSSPAKRRLERLARRRRLYQNEAAERAAKREAAWQSYRRERLMMGFGVDIVATAPEGLRDVTPQRASLALPSRECK